MDLYGKKSTSIPQKLTITFLELLLLTVSYWILFLSGGTFILDKFGINTEPGDYMSRATIFTFSCIVFIRMTFMMFYLLKRKIPWEESFSVPIAFALYYIGFALLVYGRQSPMDGWDYLGMVVFLTGSLINTLSELQRHFWKKRPEHKGMLYTHGLFQHAMHINYFGDLLWVSAYAIITRNIYSISIPLLLFCLFTFYNIPQLDAYLAKKYRMQFDAYSTKTKKFIPFIY
jgi:protein-S-isoprenylcysteine O-methyltransferase Ste14